ncbi:MAG: hypothetical protein ACK5O2_09565 [Microthrixaceae bacterium]
MNVRIRTFSAAAAVSLLTITGLSACSDGAEEQDVIEGPETSTTVSTDVPGSDRSVVAPVIVDSSDPVSIEVGRVIDITTDGVTEVESSDSAVLEVSQPSDDGSAKFNAGATAKAPGNATITVKGDSGVLYEVEVTVEGS